MCRAAGLGFNSIKLNQREQPLSHYTHILSISGHYPGAFIAAALTQKVKVDSQMKHTIDWKAQCSYLCCACGLWPAQTASCAGW